LKEIYLETACTLSSIIEEHYGNKVSIVTPEIGEGDYPWYRVNFLLYRTYEFSYEYERGFYSIYSTKQETSGLCILFSDSNSEKFDNTNFEKSNIKENLMLLDEEIRLRLPDKFLSQFD